MGSRTKPNLGGSGKATTRQDWSVGKINKKVFTPQINVPIQSKYELDAYLSATLIYCLECGTEYRSLGHHLSRAYSMPSREYKKKYNIPLTASLKCQDSYELQSNSAKKSWKDGRMENALRYLESEDCKINLSTGSAAGRKHGIYGDTMIKHKCKNCFIEFETRKKKQNFCSLKCSAEMNNTPQKGSVGGKKRAEVGVRDINGKFKAKDGK